MALGPTQRRVLKALDRPGSGVAWAIAVRIPPPHPSDSSVYSSLRSLERRGLVEQAGQFGGARTWAITPAGRAALAQGEPR